MKPEYNETHPQWERAMKHAKTVLDRSPEERAKSLRKSSWNEDGLPTQEELAALILEWADYECARLGIPRDQF